MKIHSLVGRIIRIFIWLIAGIFVLGTLGAIYQVLATKADQQNYPAPGQLVDIGGYRLHVYCMGENQDGSPTVILEQGAGGITAAWVRVQPELAEMTRVCAYDRAGLGWSETSSAPRDAEHIATELHTLLQNAKIPAPYVLVGWSYGGLYARRYAGQYREEVSGMVLLDSSHPDQWTSTSVGQAQYQSFAHMYAVAPSLARLGVMRVMGIFQPDSGLPSPQNGELRASFAATKDWNAQSAEFLASLATDDQVRAMGSLGDLPLYVLTGTEHGTPPDQEELWQAWQKDLALLSTNSVQQVVTGADHADFWLDPETTQISVQAILHVLEAVRTGEQLKPYISIK